MKRTQYGCGDFIIGSGVYYLTGGDGMVVWIVAAVISAYLLCLYPGARRSPEPFAGRCFAHRGLHDGTAACPENSLAAFAAAREASYAVELDVQLTADGQVVVFHDADLWRMCGVRGRVSELRYDEMSACRLLGGVEGIPLLQDALQALDGITVLCEVKSYGGICDKRLCERLVPLLSAYPGTVVLQSFDPLCVRRLRRLFPTMRCGLLVHNFLHPFNLSCFNRLIVSSLMLNFYARPDFISFRYTDEWHLPLWICRNMYRTPTVAWTVTDEDTRRRCRRFDAIIFEGFRPRLTNREEKD